MSSDTSVKTTNPLINTLLVISVGLSALEISQLIFDPTHASSLTSLDFDAVITQMFNGMFLNADTLPSFWSVLIAWGISGLIAGIRAKSGFWGALAAFLGTIMGAVLLLAVNLTSVNNSQLIEFALGTLSCVFIACIFAYGTGKATKAKKAAPKLLSTRKVWDSSSKNAQKIWKCSKCGEKIPPGAFSCPNCGEPVIE
ncbi:MAG: hypothetical protein ACTSR2_02590 [Candidatus Hodarchaeales archaeon]